jgi:flagellar motor switch protein FliM
MGKLGAKAKEAKALERIGEARGLMGQAAPRVARRAIRTALGHESGVTATEASMMRDVLDRTVGKAPTELRIGMADQTMQVLDMLELED